MESVPRHQCLVYEGSPSRHMPTLAVAIAQMLQRGCRCLYINSPERAAEMRSYLAGEGVDTAEEIRRGALVLTSERHHLKDGRFDIDAMMRGLEEAFDQAMDEGYSGLWATGDMTWEFGPARDFSKLVDYEWQLEEFFQTHPEMGGVCQYHADTLPREAMRQGLLTHPSIFINETLSLLNPHYLLPNSSPSPAEKVSTTRPAAESALDRLLRLEFKI